MISFLHIGLPKTGTTFLQEWLKLNSQILLRAGLTVVPSLSAHRFAVSALGEEFSDRPDIVDIRSQVTLDQAIADVRQDGAIISSEYFSIAEPKSVLEIFRKAGLTIAKTIAYLRRQDILSAACYTQDIKALGFYGVFDEVRYEKWQDFTLLKKNWSDVSQEVHLLNYDHHKANLSKSFLAVLGAPNLPVIELTQRFNVSLSAEMTEVARLLNLRQRPFSLQRLETIEGHYPGIPFGFSPQITASFERLYRDSNRKLAQIYPGEFDSFATDMWESPGQDFTGRVSEDHLADVLRYLYPEPGSADAA
jgi:hypothetical protein